MDKQEFSFKNSMAILVGPNGGGKTNLIDIFLYVLRKFIVKSWNSEKVQVSNGSMRDDWTCHEFSGFNEIVKHTNGNGRDQIIDVYISVTKSDIKNINKIIYEYDIIKKYSENANGFYLLKKEDFLRVVDCEDMLFKYTIKNNQIFNSEIDNGRCFFNYLVNSEAYIRYFKIKNNDSLSMPFLYFPVNRSVASFVSSVVLSNGEDRDKKRAIESAWSRNPASISEWALWRVGARLRELQEGNVANAKEALRSEPSIKSFSENLKQLGYEWDIDCTNRHKNIYELKLIKEGFGFNSALASSGEKEILGFLMGVFLLNVEDSLVIIDEPELHLHPRWQKFLINILTNISNSNGSQFIIATHSPFFITPKTLGFVNRVFNDGRMSLNVNFEKEIGVDGKHLLSIVNSQNNECIFFSDYVVLVEGIIDKVVFELIFEHKLNLFKNKFSLEVVCVGGKYMFKQYERLLKGCGVKYSVVGDFDYLMEVGDQCIK